MKKTPFVLLLLVLTSPVLMAQNKRQVLFDFRVSSAAAFPKIPAATERHVLSKVFRRYLTDENKCNQQFDAGGDVDRLRAARNAGQIVPSILDMAQGSFTRKGVLETAYVISVSECHASHAENFGTKRLAIFAGQQLVADMDVDFKSSVVSQTDLNGDGINELLMTTGDMAQGTLIEIAALMDFETGKVRVIEDLGTVVEDSCASGNPGSSSKRSVVSVVGGERGKFPRLRVDNYEAGCRKTKRWRFVSTGPMQ